MAALAEIVAVLVRTLQIYGLVLFVRILLSWFPNLDWGNPVLSTVASITDPFLGVFRGVIPPIAGFDLSAILAILALQVVQFLLERSLWLLAASGY